eukprot:g891.t1
MTSRGEEEETTREKNATAMTTIGEGGEGRGADRHKGDMMVDAGGELIPTPYGACKPVVLTADGKLVADITQWTLASGQFAKVYMPCEVKEEEVETETDAVVGGAAKASDVDHGEVDESGAGPRFAFPKPQADHSFATLSEHGDSVFCVAVDAKSDGSGPVMAATGGCDDVGYLHRIGPDGTSVQTVAKLGGHSDSIVAIAFNHSGKYLATGSYDGTVKIWVARGKKAGQLVGTLEGPSSEIEWLSWHKKGNVILAGSGDGSTWMWLGPDLMFMQVFTGHEARVNCGSFTANGKLVVTGSEDGTVRVWDPQSGKCKHKFSGHLWHQDSIVAIGVHHKRPLIISGATDGTVCVAHARKQKITSNFHHGRTVLDMCAKRKKEGGAADDGGEIIYGSVECVGFCATHDWAASGGVGHGGSEHGSLCIWDLKAKRLRTASVVNAGITRLAWHPSQPFVFACALDGVVRQWDARSGSVVRLWTGHRNGILDMSVLWACAASTKPLFVTASDDHTAKIFALDDGSEAETEKVTEAE